jgi:hypothetical protein
VTEYHWLPQDSSGRDLARTEAFESKEAAEAWMAREWSALLESGAEFVTLVDTDGEVVYRMGLRAQ